MNSKEEEELASTITELQTALGDAVNPPPHFAEVVSEFSTSGVSAEELDARRRAFLSRLAKDLTVGELLRRRREAMKTDLEEISRRASWVADRIEELEEDKLDLHRVEADALAALLVALNLSALGVLEVPLRAMALEQLAVYESGGGQVFGRTRRGVSSFDRRRDIQKGVAGVDREATVRRADVYVRQVGEKMAELLANRSW